MPRLRIVHSTQYRYRTPVRLLVHRLMLRPQDSHDLRLHAATLAVDPPPGSTRWAHDVFDNSVCLLKWPDALRVDHLSIVSELDLTHFPGGTGLPRATLDPMAEMFPFAYAADEVLDLARLAERQVADPGRAVEGWVEYDPTNGLTAGANLVRVGSTRAPGQAVPVAGGFVGNSDDALGMTVNVSVAMLPEKLG